MREHPIPQDIVGYRFHIIGSMTLRQFAELAAGAILGLIIYMTNLPTPIKWPLIFVAGTLGAAAAFLPIAERPLDHWISVFFKILYQPTKFFWKRDSKIPDYFLFQPGQDTLDEEKELDLTPARRQRIKEYLASVQSFTAQQDKYDQDTQGRIQEIMGVFDEVTPSEVEITQQLEKPELKIKVRSLKKQAGVKEKEVIYEQSMEQKEAAALSSSQVAQAVEIPAIEVTKVEAEQPIAEVEQVTTSQQAAYATSSDVSEEGSRDEQGATFNAALPFPNKPTQPNKLVGMVLTPNKELIPEAIIEIKDEQNRVVRAVKSNALGQFFVSTPLKSGSYSIYVDHTQYKFHPQEIMLENEIVEPIEIRSLN